MTFLWSDAWILQAIAMASRQSPATLLEVLAAADATNHALPTSDELHGAFCRLSEAGYIKEESAGFTLTPRVPADVVTTIADGGWNRGREAASQLLGAEAWSPERNTGDPRNRVEYRGLSTARIREAEQAYRRRGPRR